jgi:beta-xylosidase
MILLLLCVPLRYLRDLCGKIRAFVFLSACVQLCCPTLAAELASANPKTTYHNPIIEAKGGADPTVIRYEGKYYLYPTLDTRGYDVFVSEDLVHWEKKGKCFTDSRGGVWAPDVFYDGKGSGLFYLYYTVDNPDGGKLVGVAEATSPLGPFNDKGTLAKNAIDAHLFKDSDGALYLYYVNLKGGFKIMGQGMSDPEKATGEPKEMLHPTEAWERKHGEVTEGPWMLKHEGTYYLMYSGSGASGPDYGIGYATSKSPSGPFVKYAGNPIAHRGNGVFGPGHHCVVEGPHGGLWMLYHQKMTEKDDWNRFIALDPLWFDKEGVIHVKVTRGTEEEGP